MQGLRLTLHASAANPRKGGEFREVPDDHDVEDELAAYRLAMEPFPGYFGVFYRTDRPTKNALEADLIETSRKRAKNASAAELLEKTFNQFS